MEFEFEEFLEEVKIEMSGYEEIEEPLIKDWERRVREWIKTASDKKNRIIHKNNSIFIVLEDESDIFKVADHYLAAIDSEELDKYWQDFSLF